MAEKKKSLSDIPPIKGISGTQVARVSDIRIPNHRPTDPAPKAAFRTEATPEGYIVPGDPEYRSLYGIWKENRESGTIQKGTRNFTVGKPDGHPIFIPIKVNLDNAYGSLSGGA